MTGLNSNSIFQIQISLKWYYILLLVIPSLISTLLINPKTLQEGKWRYRRKNRRKPMIEVLFLDVIYLLLQILATILVYVVITAIAILVYSLVRYFSLSLNKTEITVLSIWRGFASAYISSHWREAIFLPCLTAIVAEGVKSRRWKVIVCVVLSMILVFASLVTNSGATKILPMEEEILAELKSSPIFDYSISDIDGFQSRVHTGYLEEGPIENSDDDKDVRERPGELDWDINSLSIDQLMDCIWYLIKTDSGPLKTYTDRAYELYSSGVETDHFDAGVILYYHGLNHDSEHLLDAASEFEEAESYWNAVLSLEEYFYYEKGTFMDFTSRAVDDALLAVDYEQAHFPMTYCEDIMKCWCWLTPDHWPFENFDSLCDAAPNEAFLNIVNAIMSIRLGDQREEDADRIEHLLSLEKYRNCPKLLLLSQYYGNEHLDELYRLYTSHPEWFEKEDRLNLAWLFYERGEYQVAVSITKGDSEDVLIRTEAFLQNPDGDLNLNKLYMDITDTINGGAGKSKPRLRLAQMIIGNRLGLETSYEGLSDICQEVFDTNSTTGLFIISLLLLH